MGQHHTLRVIHKRTNMTETASNSIVIVSYKNKIKVCSLMYNSLMLKVHVIQNLA